MALVRGKYGIEYTPRPADDDSSGLGWIYAVVALVALVSLAVTLFERVRSPVEDASPPGPEPAPAPQAAAAPDAGGAVRRPGGAPARPGPSRRRSAEVQSLLLRLETANGRRDVEMAASTIEQLREQHASEIADLDDALARRLGDLNFRRLFRDRSRLWVKRVVVKSGDSATRIAVEHGSTLASLLKLNALASPDRIRAGQTLAVMNHPRFELRVGRGSRIADLMLNGKFFRRYDLRSDVPARAGDCATPPRLRPFLASKGLDFRPADVSELELLLPSGTPVTVRPEPAGEPRA